MKGTKSTKSAISRRKFLAATGKYTVGGLAALGMLGSSQLSSQTRVPTGQTGSLMSPLSRFITNTRYDTIPPRVLETAKIAIMDCLGVAVAGASEQSAQIIGRLAREEGAKQETTIYGQRWNAAVYGERWCAAHHISIIQQK